MLEHRSSESQNLWVRWWSHPTLWPHPPLQLFSGAGIGQSSILHLLHGFKKNISRIPFSSWMFSWMPGDVSCVLSRFAPDVTDTRRHVCGLHDAKEAKRWERLRKCCCFYVARELARPLVSCKPKHSVSNTFNQAYKLFTGLSRVGNPTRPINKDALATFDTGAVDILSIEALQNSCLS